MSWLERTLLERENPMFHAPYKFLAQRTSTGDDINLALKQSDLGRVRLPQRVDIEGKTQPHAAQSKDSSAALVPITLVCKFLEETASLFSCILGNVG